MKGDREEAFETYINNHLEELQTLFCEHEDYADAFNEFCFNRFENQEQDHADFQYEMMREQQALNENENDKNDTK